MTRTRCCSRVCITAPFCLRAFISVVPPASLKLQSRNLLSSAITAATPERIRRGVVSQDQGLFQLSADRWPVVLHEVFQAGEHHAPVPFRTLARLVAEIVVLTQRYACLRFVAGQVHGHD